MRICKCGGILTQHVLVRNREAWTCTECGRYEVIDRGLDKPLGSAIVGTVNDSGDDKPDPLTRGFCRETGRAAITESISLKGFLLSGLDTPLKRLKHDRGCVEKWDDVSSNHKRVEVSSASFTPAQGDVLTSSKACSLRVEQKTPIRTRFCRGPQTCNSRYGSPFTPQPFVLVSRGQSCIW